jgi:hypothetical protein
MAGPIADQPPALAFLAIPDDVSLALQSRLDALVGDGSLGIRGVMTRTRRQC